MKTVHDFMSSSLLTIPSFKTLSEALEILLDNNISSAPVVDNYGEPIGLLSEFALIKAFLKMHNGTEDKDKNQVFYFKSYFEPVTIIEETAGVTEAIKALFANPTHRILVRAASGKVVGIVSPRDILKVISGDIDHISKIERELIETRESLRKVAGKLQDSEEIVTRYHAYLEDAPFNIHSVNEQGRVIFANKMLRTALGYSSAEIIGMALENLYTPEQAEKARAGLSSIMKNGNHTPVITTMKTKDGGILRVEAISSSLHAPNGTFVATITMSRRLASDNMLRALNGVLDIEKSEPFE